MEPMRRTTRKHVEQGNLIRDIMIQVHMAQKAGEVTEEFRECVVPILYRMQTRLWIQAGMYDRAKQARYDRRNPDYTPRIIDAVIAVIVIICLFAIAN